MPPITTQEVIRKRIDTLCRASNPVSGEKEAAELASLALVQEMMTLNKNLSALSRYLETLAEHSGT